MNKLKKVFIAFILCLTFMNVSLIDVEASSQGDKLVSVAMAEQGNSYKSKYGATKNAWCASFVSWAARQAGIPTSIIPSTESASGMKSAVVSLGGKVVSSPQKGDLVFYKHSKTGSICHVAIMTSSTMSIHGNYSNKVTYMAADNYYDSRNVKTTRSRMIFVRPKYGALTTTAPDNSTPNNTTNNNSNTNTNTTVKPTVKPTVTKTSIAKFTVKGITEKVEYTGKAIKPEITLYNGSKKIASSNYTVSYSKNTNPGKATVTITGKGDYTGTITKTFTILEVDYSALNKAKKSVPADLSIYTDETVTALNTTLTAVNKLKSTSVQKTVDDSTNKLTKAIAALVIKKADYTLVDAALEKVPTDLSDYTKESIALLNSAIEVIDREKLITEQDVVNQMALSIEDAIASLELNPLRSEVVVPIALGAIAIACGVFFISKKKLKVNKA